MSKHGLTPLTAEQITQLLQEERLKVLDKPSGISSHSMVNQVRRQTGIKRVGHAGTLDPLATGVLLVLVGRETTRLQDQFMGMEKEYLFTAELGRETDTYDALGETTKMFSWEDVSAVSRSKLENVLKQFVGEYQQQVPAYSAIKIHGRKLYDMARKKQLSIDLPSRKVKIISIELLDFYHDQDQQKSFFTCRVVCGSGTYIRSLAVDIGHALDLGATVTALRRTRIGQFRVNDY